MAELDVETLKRRWNECVRLVDGAAVAAKQTQRFDYYRAQTALFEEFIRQAPEVVAALEDRDRLRAAIDQHNIQRVLDDSHEEGWDLAARIVEQDAEIARLETALEGRDG